MDINELNDLSTSLLQRSTSSTSLPSPSANIPDPVPSVVLAEEKKQREAMAGTMDYVKAVVNQDFITPGLIAAFQGHQFIPQEGYSSFKDPETWKSLTEGIAPDFHNEFYSATSPDHAEYIRLRLLRKQSDLTHLSDMGWKGNTARLVAGFLNPENLVPAVASGGISLAARLGSTATKVAKAGEAAQAIRQVGTATAVAEGIAGGAAGNAAFEKLRQSVNFEDDSSHVLEAALMGAAFTTPFAIAGARQASRMGTMALREREALELLKAEREGHVLTSEDHAKLAEHQKVVEVYTQVERGELPPEELDKVLPQNLPETPEPTVVTPEPDEKSGFTPGTGFLAGSIGSAQVAHVSAPETTLGGNIPYLDKLGIKIPWRWDLYAKLNKSSNPVVQRFAQMAIKDPIGSKDGFTQGRTASEDKKLFQRVQEGRWMLAAQESLEEAAKARGMGPLDKARWHRDFHEMVTEVANGDTAVIHANPDIAPHLEKAAASMRQVFKETLEAAKKAGVQGAENVEVNDFYINRQWQADKIRQAMRDHGEDNVARMVANSFTDSRLRGDTNKAKAFLKVILKSEFGHHMQDLHLADRNEAKLREALAAPDHNGHQLFSKQDIDTIIETLFEAKDAAKEPDAGNAPNLKMRMPLDETYAEKMPNGQVLKPSDLMERDSRVLVNKYLNSMAGHIAFAKRGIRSRAEFEAAIANAAVDHHMNTNLLDPESKDFKDDMQWVRDIYDNITGRPMSTQVFNTTSRISNMVRAWSRSAYLGQLGIPAAGEMKQTVALTSLRALYLQGGSFAQLINALRSGRLPTSDLARQVETFWGMGLEHTAAHARQHEFTEFTHDRTLSKLENAANKVSHAVDSISGNSSITSASRQMSAMMFIQHHYDLATGRMELTPAKIKRLAHQGIEDSEVHDVLGHLKKYTTEDSTNGRVVSVDWERWHREHPDTYNQYHLAVERETRDAIQDHDLGETIPWSHTQLGKIFMELRTFISVAHAKNFLKNASYADKTTFSVWMYGLTGEALMYSLQTSLNFAHNKEELQKRLSLERIAQAAVQRASAFGMMPAVLSTGYWVGSGGNDLFGHAGTANTDNRNILKTPSGMLLSDLYNAPKTLAGGLNPWSETITTKQEVRHLFSLLPFGNDLAPA